MRPQIAQAKDATLKLPVRPTSVPLQEDANILAQSIRAVITELIALPRLDETLSSLALTALENRLSGDTPPTTPLAVQEAISNLTTKKSSCRSKPGSKTADSPADSPAYSTIQNFLFAPLQYVKSRNEVSALGLSSKKLLELPAPSEAALVEEIAAYRSATKNPKQLVEDLVKVVAQKYNKSSPPPNLQALPITPLNVRNSLATLVEATTQHGPRTEANQTVCSFLFSDRVSIETTGYLRGLALTAQDIYAQLAAELRPKLKIALERMNDSSKSLAELCTPIVKGFGSRQRTSASESLVDWNSEGGEHLMRALYLYDPSTSPDFENYLRASLTKRFRAFQRSRRNPKNGS